MADKFHDYETLVDARKACFHCEGLVNPATCSGGVLDSSEIGVWSSWQGNLDAFAMVVGQDWGNEAAFLGQNGRDDPSETNKLLQELTRVCGSADQPSFWNPAPGRTLLHQRHPLLEARP